MNAYPTAHPTIDEIRRWKRGELSREDVIDVGRHLAECSSCANAWEENALLSDSVDALREQIEVGEAHPDLEEELFKYADGLFSKQRRSEIEQHLEICIRCREDVEDLIGPIPRRPRVGSRWIAYAAAAAVILVISVILMRIAAQRDDKLPKAIVVVPTDTTHPPKPPRVDEPPPYERAEWNELVRRARAGAPLLMPAVLQSLRQSADPLRGSSGTSAVRLVPDGLVIETARPTFTWPATEGARSTLFVFEGTREVAHSESLTTKRWTPQHDLRRGITYTWQVEVEVDGTRNLLPSPPAAPARFHILDATTLEVLDAARERHASDHLLLALLYARAGLDDRAAAELALVTDAAEVPIAKRLMREVRSWKHD